MTVGVGGVPASAGAFAATADGGADAPFDGLLATAACGAALANENPRAARLDKSAIKRAAVLARGSPVSASAVAPAEISAKRSVKNRPAAGPGGNGAASRRAENDIPALQPGFE